MSRLKDCYTAEAVPALLTEFGYTNVMAIPKITLKAGVVNMGLGEATQNAKIINTAAEELGRIAGQKPVVTRARKSIASFRLREGYAVGLKVTLRGQRMYEFLDRLMTGGACRASATSAAWTRRLRRPRQLLDGPDRARRVSGDQPGQGDVSAGHEYHDLHHGAATRRRAGC